MPSGDPLHHFAKAVAVRQLEQEDALDEETVRRVALDLGMTEEEILKARAEGENKKQMARTLRSQGLVEEAIAELEQAHAFAPLDVEAMTMLADVLYARSKKTKDESDLERARRLCLAALRAAPSHHDAASLLAVIKMNPMANTRVDQGAVTGLLIAVGLAIAAVAAVAMWLLF
jgi:tetratricopeptide (TPR) repeat protein